MFEYVPRANRARPHRDRSCPLSGESTPPERAQNCARGTVRKCSARRPRNESQSRPSCVPGNFPRTAREPHAPDHQSPVWELEAEIRPWPVGSSLSGPGARKRHATGKTRPIGSGQRHDQVRVHSSTRRKPACAHIYIPGRRNAALQYQSIRLSNESAIAKKPPGRSPRLPPTA